MNELHIVMPAYNEASNIEETIRQWYPVVEKIGNSAKLVIANDGSKDDTYIKMVSLKDRFPLLIPLDKPNTGHGATVLFLYRYAIENGAEYVFQTDSDGQTNPDEFWQMWENRNNYDFQIGHRVGRQDGGSRVFVTRILRYIVWLMFHEWVVDPNTPFRLLKVAKLKPILKVIPQDFFLCNVAISAIAVKWGYKIGWYKISFKPRQGGVNSINMRRIVRIGWKAIGDFRKINSSLERS